MCAGNDVRKTFNAMLTSSTLRGVGREKTGLTLTIRHNIEIIYKVSGKVNDYKNKTWKDKDTCSQSKKD